MAKDDAGNSDSPKGLDIGGDGIWVLVPLAALMIPILAVSDGAAGGRAIPIAVAACMVIAVAAVVARTLMAQRHVFRMKELRAERAIAEIEAQQLVQANQVIESNATIRELRKAVADDSIRATQTIRTTDT